jgi:pantetheine-phosphate adenylyltransferase
MKEAIYAASLDPITYGHVNIVERALNVFDRLLVGIGVNETKQSLFSLEERETMARKELARFGTRVRVKSFQGMLSDFAYENNIHTVIRGARSTPDFDYEKLLSDINRYCGVDTIIYTTIPRLAHVSSSAAKAITLNTGKNILDYVSMSVKHRLEEVLLEQYRVGITGVIGSGKSHITERFYQFIVQNMLPLVPHIIDMDLIGHYILEKGTEPIYKRVREEVCYFLKIKKIDIKKIREKIFDDAMYSSNRDGFNKIMREPTMYELRKTLLKEKGNIGRRSFVIITGALLCEMRGLDEFNNNLILVDSPKELIIKRLQASRGYSDEVIKQRMGAQLNLSCKGLYQDEKAKEDGYGKAWYVQNDGHLNVQELDSIFEKVLKDLGCICKGYTIQ